MLEQIDDYIIFEFSDSEEYYFKSIRKKHGDDEKYSTEYQVHSGMFQDSVLLWTMSGPYDRDMDYRFFPYLGNYIRFYAWNENYNGKVYVKNSGEHAIIVEIPNGKFKIPAGDCLELISENEYDCTGDMGTDKLTMEDIIDLLS